MALSKEEILEDLSLAQPMEDIVESEDASLDVEDNIEFKFNVPT